MEGALSYAHYPVAVVFVVVVAAVVVAVVAFVVVVAAADVVAVVVAVAVAAGVGVGQQWLLVRKPVSWVRQPAALLLLPYSPIQRPYPASYPRRHP